MLKFEELPEVNSERWLSTEPLKGERWKPLRGYEKEYRISNYGRLLTLPRNGIPNTKICMVNLSGRYWRVGLRKNDRRHYFSVHRLVAETFIPNPDNLPQVDHINNNRMDNRVANLRWTTAKQNRNNPLTVIEHHKAMFRLRKNEHCRRVIKMSMSGEVLDIYQSVRDAARITGIDRANIRAAALGKKKWVRNHWATVRSAGGFRWKFE